MSKTIRTCMAKVKARAALFAAALAATLAVVAGPDAGEARADRMPGLDVRALARAGLVLRQLERRLLGCRCRRRVRDASDVLDLTRTVRLGR